MPDSDQLRGIVERWYELWNADDKEGWLAHMRSVAPGTPSMEDPVGKPVKRGWDMVEELWDRTGKDHFPVAIQKIFVCGDEVAAVCRSEGTWRGTSFCIDSVDVHQFEDDSWTVRAYWDISTMGELPYRQWTSTAGEPVGQGRSAK